MKTSKFVMFSSVVGLCMVVVAVVCVIHFFNYESPQHPVAPVVRLMNAQAVVYQVPTDVKTLDLYFDREVIVQELGNRILDLPFVEEMSIIKKDKRSFRIIFKTEQINHSQLFAVIYRLINDPEVFEPLIDDPAVFEEKKQ